MSAMPWLGLALGNARHALSKRIERQNDLEYRCTMLINEKRVLLQMPTGDMCCVNLEKYFYVGSALRLGIQGMLSHEIKR